MVERYLFFGLVLVLILQRIFELKLSGRNERWIISQGGFEVGAGHYQIMKILHVLWFAAMVGEVLWFNRVIVPSIALIALVVFLAGQALRYSAILTLKQRWTVKVMILPGAPVTHQGVYRWIRHPNYLGVILEIASFPLLGNAWITSLVFSLANAFLLTYRIRTEENALGQYNAYQNAFSRLPRFISITGLASILRKSKHEDPL